jgi:hypothetical protein
MTPAPTTAIFALVMRTISLALPGRTAALSAAMLIRDRLKLSVRYGPGSAAPHFVQRRARDKRDQPAV